MEEYRNPFEGRLVRLRAREMADAPQFHRWINDPEVTQHITARYPLSMAQEKKHLEDGAAPDYRLALFATETLEGKLIGWCGLHADAPENHSASLGISIGEKAYWNGGYGTDTMRVLCRFGFEHMNLHRIELTVFATNPRAVRVYEKVGFQHEGCLREWDFRYGAYRDCLVMGLLRGELKEVE